MIKIPTQFKHQCPHCGVKYEHFIPIGDDAVQQSREYMPNQILTSTFQGYRHPRSVEQLNAYWKGCTIVAELISDHEKQYTKEEIDFDVKVALRHIKSFRVVNGVTFLEVDSISFANLKHLEACHYFDRAFNEMARMAGITVDELMDMIGVVRDKVNSR